MNLQRIQAATLKPTITSFLIPLLALCGVAISDGATAAQTILLIIHGPDITGNSGDVRCPNCIRLSGYTQTVQNIPSSGGGAGSAVCGPVTITKSLDRSSNVMVQGALSGTHYSSATLYFYNDANPQDFWQIDLGGVVMIQSVTATDNKATGAGIVEQVVLSATTFMYTFNQQAATGSGSGPAPLGYDCGQMSKL
jgi:type VI protein secretion system component Hcp